MTPRLKTTTPIKSASSNDPVHQVWYRCRDWGVRQRQYHSDKMEPNGDVTMTSLFLLTPLIKYASLIDPLHQVCNQSRDWCFRQSRTTTVKWSFMVTSRWRHGSCWHHQSIIRHQLTRRTKFGIDPVTGVFARAGTTLACFPIVNCIDPARNPCLRGGSVAKYVKLWKVQSWESNPSLVSSFLTF